MNFPEQNVSIAFPTNNRHAGYVFGDLSVKLDDSWVVIDRYCVICRKRPVDLLTRSNYFLECGGTKSDFE